MKEKLLERIRGGELTMRPRAYFTIKIVILGLVAIAILVVSVSILNFISFSLRLNGHDSLLRFGPQGALLFLQLFPWMLLITDIVLVVFLEWLVRQFRFGSKIPILYLLAGILIATVSVGLVIDRGTTFNDTFLDRADQHRLPGPFGDYFEGARRSPSPDSGMCKCTVTAIKGNILSAEDIDVGTTTHLTIIVPFDDSHATTSSLSVGDVVFIAGIRHGNTIEAFGISTSRRGSPTHD